MHSMLLAPLLLCRAAGICIAGNDRHLGECYSMSLQGCMHRGMTVPPMLCRYGFEALVYNEYHGATGFFFTPYAQKRIPGAKLPSVEVDGDTILGTFGFETENIRNNVAVLVVLLCAYLTITLLLLIFKRH